MIEKLAALDAIGRLPEEEIDILAAAIELGRAQMPAPAVAAAQAHGSELARAAAAMSDDGTAVGRAAALTALLVDHHGYRGDSDTYEDPRNANLVAVLQRRRGLPVALGIVWIHAAGAAGWTAYGIDFPGHFLLGLSGAADSIILDVFSGGTPCDARDLRAMVKRIEGPKAELRPELLRPMGNRAILLRLQNNIKLRRLQAGDTWGALASNGTMLRIAPDAAPLWNDAALLHQRLGELREAVRCYERLLELLPDGADARHTRDALAELRARLN
jgi:regulator of sirC expression with transglutaminase-like and TPR domain